METDNTVMKIQLVSTVKVKPEKIVKQRNPRVVSTTKKWDGVPDSVDDQLQILLNLETSPHKQLVYNQISTKLAGYKQQDVDKHIFNPVEFITFDQCIQAITETALECHYCHQLMYLLYEYVREPKQWSLDRIDNSVGHNSGNVVVACLSCNLKRRCIAKDKFFFTKNLKIKMDG